MAADLDKVFKPRTLALVGASNSPGKWGSFLLVNLLSGGYPKEDVFPVNLKEKEVHGLPAYPGLSSLPQKPDLVVITTPAKTVGAILEECSQQDIKHVVVISSNFSEVSEEGAQLEEEIAAIARKHDLTMVGYAVGAPLQLHPGKISFVSQSGNVGANMLGWTMNQGIGFGKFVGSGNEAVLHAEDYIEYFGNDKETDLILAYLEGVDNGRKFIQVASSTCLKKPVIVLKSARTDEGGRAAMSHTGSMAGADTIYEAAFRQSGIIRADTSQEMLDLAKSFGRLPLPCGDRLGILTLGGGWGVIATDATASAELQMAELDDDVMRVCNELLPPFWSHGNPVDLVGDIHMDTHIQIMEAMVRSPDIDAMVVLGTLGTSPMIGLTVLVSERVVRSMSDEALKGFISELRNRNRRFLRKAHELMNTYMKPIVFVEMQFVGEEYLRDLEAGESVIFTAPEKAAGILAKMLHYQRYLKRKGRDIGEARV
jgi:acyl-CoA synthetase (NDP forming)